MAAVNSIRFRNDKRLRDKLFTAESYQHPAKGHLGMWQTIIEKYTAPGDTILDPMSGVGATLTAALMGRNVICVELEPHFITPMRASWEKMRQHPMLGHTLGEVLILRGDARHLPIASADHIITSPPFQDQEPQADSEWFREHRKEFGGGGLTGHYTRPSAIISSPPYANRLADSYVDDDPQRMSYEMGKAKIDAVVTSPSYEGTTIGRIESLGEAPFGGPNSQTRGVEYARGNGENIGNQRGNAYWESMRQVYAECHRVLRPGGIMVLVLKGFTRDGKYIDLPGQTADLVESLGLKLFDTWQRELWSLSFWRILQKRRDPEAFDDRLNFESVLAFRKPPPMALEP